MPTQRRGFFSCDYCGLVCDTLEEAKEHELRHCTKRPGNQTNVTETPAQPPQTNNRYPPSAGHPTPFGTMPPAIQHPDMEGFPPHYRGMVPHDQNKPVRSITLMGPHDKTSMSVEDSIACQNIELFEATPEDVTDFSQEENPVVAKQVGIRCLHCAKTSAAPNSTVFPDSLGKIAASVRVVADNHLIACERVPPEIRESCDRAASKRAQEPETEGKEENENDRDQMALIGYCVDFCHRLGVVNKQPHKTGIEFAEGMEMLQYPHPATTPIAPRGVPPGPFSADRMGPPMSMERLPFRTPGPPGSFPRGRAPMMGGPGGPEGIAPTPLQSRRDREGQGGYAGGREGAGAGAPAAGFPTPYQQGMAGGEYGAGMQTPAQPNYEGQEGTPYPPSSARTENSPPSGYQDTPQFDLPQNFPFYQESNRTWHCKFCSHVHPQYRDPQSIWSSPNGGPPPGNFIDEHLSICRAYYQSMPSPPMYQGGPPGPYGAPMMGIYGPPPGAYENFQYPGQPPFPYPPHHPDSRYPGEEYAERRPGAPPGQGPSSRTVGSQQMQGKENSAEAIAICVNHLVAKESEYYARDPENAKIPRLVLDEDKLLLTDYFFYLMKQLRLCRFSESDRKTRGGKREKIKIGYGGLQCVHCADVANSRKFFWSNVDRLANSFAEIPGHILKCRRCPQQTKDALRQLKSFHPEQMSRLPRGSQKVFFRRMWRRLHDEDPGATIDANPSNEENITPEKKAQPESPQGKDPETPKEPKEAIASPAGSPASPGSAKAQRTTKEAAKALAESGTQSGDILPSSRVMLAIPEDKEWLSDMDCFIRNQLEVFCATAEDVATAQTDRKYPIHVGQVGIRCIHCSTGKKGGAQGQAVAYPFSVTGIYESVREFQRLHLDSCEDVPAETKSKLKEFKGASSLSSVLRKYYILAAKGLGLRDTREGIQASGESAPIGPQSAFSFSKGETGVLEEVAAISQGQTSGKSQSPSNHQSPSVDTNSESGTKPESGTKRSENSSESEPLAKKLKTGETGTPTKEEAV